MPYDTIAPISAAVAGPFAADVAAAGHSSPLPNGGSLSPAEAWELIQGGGATLVDVRTAEELKFVGQVPNSLHVPWATGTAMTRNPRFVRELEAKVGKDRPVLLLCRSGKRSALAVEAAIKAGFTQIANIAEGFEGDIDALGHRGLSNGWRFHGLPWVQD
ncbi:rhodanese-like domain-containing protein [uncultured Nevskia sp.]|uniref:rhodanese-like domain-containing protein n=1 Tax=uncultured Nevskia sp. TaxID=228950 RepID=UPI0025F89C3F|nr:rhodanese-like domain-containing protein [uncultured Nevskia sp.]